LRSNWCGCRQKHSVVHADNSKFFNCKRESDGFLTWITADIHEFLFDGMERGRVGGWKYSLQECRGVKRFEVVELSHKRKICWTFVICQMKHMSVKLLEMRSCISATYEASLSLHTQLEHHKYLLADAVTAVLFRTLRSRK